MYLPDYNDLFAEHDAKQAQALAKLQVCAYCGEPIQDDFYYEINDEPICEECLKAHYRKSTDDFIE